MSDVDWNVQRMLTQSTLNICNLLKTLIESAIHISGISLHKKLFGKNVQLKCYILHSLSSLY